MTFLNRCVQALAGTLAAASLISPASSLSEPIILSENARAITILVPETPGLNPLVYVDLVVPVTKNPGSKDVEVVFEHVQVIHANLDFIVAAEKGFKFITLLLTAEQAKVFAKLPHTTRSKFRARLSTAK